MLCAGLLACVWTTRNASGVVASVLNAPTMHSGWHDSRVTVQCLQLRLEGYNLNVLLELD